MAKSYPTYEYEKTMLAVGYKFVAGVDEAGRGPGAGPVVAAAVYIPECFHTVDMFDGDGKLNDSKKMTAKQRDKAYKVIVENCDFGVGVIDNNIVDDINILEATKLAMLGAIRQLKEVDCLLIDGTVKVDTPLPQKQLIKGDAVSNSIAAASILAKVTRDRLMKKLHRIFPIYGWDTNKGYLTKKHMEAIIKYGPCVYHRMSFKRVGR